MLKTFIFIYYSRAGPDPSQRQDLAIGGGPASQEPHFPKGKLGIFLYEISSIFLISRKKINLLEFRFLSLINYILINVNLLAYWEYVFLDLKVIFLED